MKKLSFFAKFNGDIEKISKDLNANCEKLNNNIAIVEIDSDKLRDLKNHKQIQCVECAYDVFCSDNRTFLESTCVNNISKPPDNLTGNGVIVAILDSGIDIYHPDFISNNDETRIISIWDQNGNENPPEEFDFGTEYTSDEINLALNNRIEFPRLDNNGHGTAVCGIACGNGRASNFTNMGVAPESSIIAVKLMSSQNSFSTSTINLSRGIKYIINRAQTLDMPVVINISYGTNMGAHDGQSLFEQYLDFVCENRNTSVVVATGNEGSAKHHFKYVLKNGDIVDINFVIKKNFTEFSIFFVKSFYDEINFQFENSSGEKSSIMNLYQMSDQNIYFSKTKIFINLNQPTPLYEGEQIIFTFSSFSGFIPQDIWTIKVFARKIYDGRIDAWLPITEESGIETQFLNPNPETTLTIPSTSAKVISVGGYNSIDNDFAEFSGRGYTKNGLVSPDLIAPSVSVISTNLNGSYSNFTGTSFASPFVSGACALMMQWGIINKNDLSMYGQRLKAFLKLGARKEERIIYPNDREGYGVLCVKSSLDYAKRYVRTKNFDENDFENYYQFRGLQLNENINSQKDEKNFNPVTDENYMDFIINYDESLVKFLENEPNIIISSIIRNKYAIIHFTKEDYEYYRRNSQDLIVAERAMICGLCVESYSAITASGISAVKIQPFLQLRGSGTLIGIVDDGIDFYNECFRYENGETKILYYWDQTSDSGNPPEQFSYGTELTSKEINEYILNSSSKDNFIDNTGHGTFLSSVMSGRQTESSNFEGASPDSNIIFVKLKRAKKVMKEYNAIFTDVPSFQSNDIITGVEYILDISAKLGKPVVINIPLQTNEGAHDGLSYFEQYFSDVSTMTGVGIIIPVGNQGNKSEHVQAKIEQSDEPYKIEFVVSRGELGFIINLWTSVPDRVSISIVSPLGNIIEREKFTVNTFKEYNFILEGTKISIQYIFPDVKNGNQNIRIRFLNPTSGLWNLNIFGDLIIYGIVDVWLPISQFLSQETSFLGATIENTVTVPSTALNVISVGAYDFIDQSIYISSGRGQVLYGRVKPDFVAPGVDVDGIYPNNQLGTMTGTGIASAIVTGASSLLMEWGLVKQNDVKINTLRLKSYLLLGCSQNENIKSPNNVWGYGKINLIETFRKIR